jgi:hypothetical protein
MTRATIPGNHVLALVKDSATASKVAGELAELGLDEATIVTDPMVGELLEAENGLLARALQRLSHHLSEETNYLDQYEEAVRKGQTVVAVKATGHDKIRQAKEVLQKHGAMDIRYFGRLAVSDLTPDSNPSMASDEPPLSKPGEHG